MSELKAFNMPRYAGQFTLHEVYLKSEADKTIAELKAKLDRAIAERDGNQVCIDALKQKLENVQASMYADVVDANMENRRLKRALWIARAKRAEAEHAHWATIWFCNTKISLNINKSSVSQDPYKSNTFRNASEWRNMWYDISSKCIKKAEEYK